VPNVPDWTEIDDSPVEASGVARVTATVSASVDLVAVEITATDADALTEPVDAYVNGETGTSYSYEYPGGTSTTGTTRIYDVAPLPSGESTTALLTIRETPDGLGGIVDAGFNDGDTILRWSCAGVSPPINSVTVERRDGGTDVLADWSLRVWGLAL
jgi:hypothetical protein